MKPIEHLLDIGRGYTHARVLHAEQHLPILHIDLHGDLPFKRIFEGVSDKIDHDLLPKVRVDIHKRAIVLSARHSVLLDRRVSVNTVQKRKGERVLTLMCAFWITLLNRLARSAVYGPSATGLNRPVNFLAASLLKSSKLSTSLFNRAVFRNAISRFSFVALSRT